MPIKALFKSFNSKLLGIATVAIAIVITLLLLNELSILALLVLWNFGALTAIVLWERQRRNDSLELKTSHTNDERWTRIKMDLERTEKRLKKSKDPEKRRALVRYKARLENEFRRLEWSIRESNMNAMYNAGNGGLRGAKSTDDSSPREMIDSDTSSPPKRGLDFDPSDALGGRMAVRRRAQLEMEYKERRNLENALDAAQAIIDNEPPVSLSSALQPIANDCRAHYNLIKKRGRFNPAIIGDYWVAWSLILTVQNRRPFDFGLVKYASKEFKQRANKFMNSVDAVRYSKIESVPYVRKEKLTDFISDTGFGLNEDSPEGK